MREPFMDEVLDQGGHSDLDGMVPLQDVVVISMKSEQVLWPRVSNRRAE
jgi:hypothetical protein